MKLQTVKIIDLKFHPKNPNTHPELQVKELQNSLDQFDQVKNIVVWQGLVIAGNGLLEAAKSQNRETIEIQDVSDWPEEKALKFMIADNRLPQLAIMDDDILSGLLIDFDEPLDIPGIDEDFLDGLDLGDCLDDGETDPDDVPEVVEPIVKSGELWCLGEHRLLCGDTTKKEDVERLMCGEKADLCFTDPPYGVSYADKNAYLNTISRVNCIQTEIKNDHESVESMYNLWCITFNMLGRNLTDTASYYICSPQGGELILMQAIYQSPPALKHTIIWNKNNHVLGRSDYNYKHEPILYGWKKKGTHVFYGKGEMQTSVWEIDKPLKNDLHPTMKPISLILNALLNSSDIGNLVIDPFFGSDSTLIACEKTNRKCYGMEIDEHYCTVILQRWADFTGKDPIREDGVKFSELKTPATGLHGK